MPSSNSPPVPSSRATQGRSDPSRQDRRTRRRRQSPRTGYVERSGEAIVDESNASHPIVQQRELGSAATMSTLARHRLSRQRDHDPAGMTVQQAVEQLGEHNNSLNAALREPLPTMPDDDDARDAENGEPRRKRRKRDNDPLSQREIPQYGYMGRVVPGKLQMQIMTCDGGEHQMSEKGDLQVENILLENESTYCSETPKCNIILKHRGEAPFALTKLVIRNPKNSHKFSSRLQEGLVFVSMGADDLHFRTERYDLVKESSAEPSPSNPPAAMSELRRLRLSLQEAVRVQQQMRAEGSAQRRGTLPAHDNYYARYQAVRDTREMVTLSEQAARDGIASSAEERLRELIDRNPALLRHNSWQQIEPDGGSARVSTAAQTDLAATSPPEAADATVGPSLQGFHITTTDDPEEAAPNEVEENRRVPTGISRATIRGARRGLDSLHAAQRSTARNSFSQTSIDDAYDYLTQLEAEVANSDESEEEEEEQIAIRAAANVLPSMRMEPNDEYPLLDNSRQLRRAGRRHGSRLSRPRKVEWVPNKVKRPDMGTGAVGEQVMKPHAHFFIKQSSHSVALEFSPPVSGRYILFKLWAPPGKEDIDVQSIIAHGYAGPRMFPSTDMR